MVCSLPLPLLQQQRSCSRKTDRALTVSFHRRSQEGFHRTEDNLLLCKSRARARESPYEPRAPHSIHSSVEVLVPEARSMASGIDIGTL